MDYVMIWIISCALAWSMTGASTSIGDTIYSPGYRKFIRLLGFFLSLIAILTTPALGQAFAVSLAVAGFQNATAIAGLSFLLWSSIHLSGAAFTVVRTGIRIATDNL